MSILASVHVVISVFVERVGDADVKEIVSGVQRALDGELFQLEIHRQSDEDDELIGIVRGTMFKEGL